MSLEAIMKVLSFAAIFAVWWMIMRRTRYFERWFGWGRRSREDRQDNDLD